MMVKLRAASAVLLCALCSLAVPTVGLVAVPREDVEPRRAAGSTIHRRQALSDGQIDYASDRWQMPLVAGDAECVLEPERIVASFATTGSAERMVYLKRTLLSIAKQSVQPDRIIVTFPDRFIRKNLEVKIPKEAKTWEPLLRTVGFKGEFTIQQMKDYGPASKLIGALRVEKKPETVVVIFDDDVEYHLGTIKALLCKMQRVYRNYKRDVAACFAGQKLCQTSKGARYVRTGQQFPGFGEGFGGIAYRVRYFDDYVFKVQDKGIPEGCFVNDDVWIAAAMYRASKVRPALTLPGFKSVIRHGSCDHEACGWASNSSAVENEDTRRNTGRLLRKECEVYFDWCENADVPLNRQGMQGDSEVQQDM